MPRDGQNLFAMFSIMRFRYIEVFIHIFYYYWGKENRLFYQGRPYIKLRSIAGSTVVQFYSVQTYPDLLKTAIFFLRLSLPSTRKRRFPPQKPRFLKTVSRKEIFQNAGFSFTCGRTKTEFFSKTMMSYIIHTS